MPRQRHVITLLIRVTPLLLYFDAATLPSAEITLLAIAISLHDITIRFAAFTLLHFLRRHA